MAMSMVIVTMIAVPMVTVGMSFGVTPVVWSMASVAVRIDLVSIAMAEQRGAAVIP